MGCIPFPPIETLARVRFVGIGWGVRGGRHTRVAWQMSTNVGWELRQMSDSSFRIGGVCPRGESESERAWDRKDREWGGSFGKAPHLRWVITLHLCMFSIFFFLPWDDARWGWDRAVKAEMSPVIPVLCPTEDLYSNWRVVLIWPYFNSSNSYSQRLLGWFRCEHITYTQFIWNTFTNSFNLYKFFKLFLSSLTLFRN